MNQQGSKDLLRKSKNRKEKARHLGIYLFKVLLTLIFCFVFVSVYSVIFGAENGTAGVVVLLTVMVFRQADLGFKASQSALTLVGIFAIMAVGPRLANILPPVLALPVNIVCLFALLVLGCHNIILSNHSTFVLGYLLLYGYDVQGHAYLMRLAALGVGAVITALILYRNHYSSSYKRGLLDVLREFRMDSTRTRWQFRLGVGVPLAMFAGQCLGFERVMWIGIAVMSFLQPFYEDMKKRITSRIPGTVGGCLLFLLLTVVVPEQYYSFLGILGGLCVGFCATYGWQTVFNALGALATAMSIYGMTGAIGHRLADNIFGAVFALVFSLVFELIVNWFKNRQDSGCTAES